MLLAPSQEWIARRPLPRYASGRPSRCGGYSEYSLDLDDLAGAAAAKMEEEGSIE